MRKNLLAGHGVNLYHDAEKTAQGHAAFGVVVEITYQPVMLARYGDGTVFLEVHPDPYRRSGRSEAQVGDLLRTVGLEHLSGSSAVRSGSRAADRWPPTWSS